MKTRDRFKHLLRPSFPVLVLLALGTTSLIYRDVLLQWFTTQGAEPTGTRRTNAPGAADSGSPPTSRPAQPTSMPAERHAHPALRASTPPYALTPSAFDEVQVAFRAYETSRRSLADDQSEGIADQAARIERALTEAATSLTDAPQPVTDALLAGAAVAHELTSASSIELARKQFGGLSEQLVTLANVDPRLQEGRFVFLCPMASGFQKWFQESAQIENPYMGQKMPTCGSETQWSAAAESSTAGDAHAGHAHTDGDILYYTCSMHPSVKQDSAGKCPICGMDLTPVTRHEAETGVIVVDAVRRQRIGVRTGKVENRELTRTIRAVGRISYDETRVHDVTLRVEGWIGRLHVDTTGQRVRKGQPLFTAYSPELFSAQLELLAAQQSDSSAGRLAKAARQRLKGWGLNRKQIDAVLERGAPSEEISFPSPAAGFVVEKNIVGGAHVRAGERLYRIASMDRVWVEADVYEQDLPHVTVGALASVTLPYVRGRSFEGVVAYVYPYLAPRSRTAKVRIELENPDGELRADMFANVELTVSLGNRLSIPTSAVVYTGPRRLVFVDLGEGRLRPQEVTIGARAGEFVEVLSGLEEGDTIVSSGNFLIAAESRIRSAATYWTADDGHDD